MSQSILCPTCHAGTWVTDSRPVRKINSTKRRRRCVACGYRFTTYERISVGRTQGNCTFKGAASHVKRALISLENLAREAGEMEDLEKWRELGDNPS